ncbi:dynein axonemal assembly factor 3-like [Neoarius graeffei]|uniref:dynein axonemal assembly factor 3-like n=1 Tax=Neoarius graeffei TaxID=443677 RepID=UPI00298D1A71|nr:dynein axonemal assembly factor 3-like [Neoarius graeffei]XP_060777098.1 dynein axonemal assembly factor 3-like [Neoarius graeffei]
MSAGQTLEGAGCVTWWGFGPARDLLKKGVPRTQGELNVLLVGSSDPRHVLKTISGLKDTDSLHLWVMENSMEVVARQLLLLYVSLSTPESMGMQEKTEVFLELFGNSEIRSETDSKLKHVASQLSLSVTDSLDADTPYTHPCLDTSLLKFKERDELARIFKQWQRPPSTPLSMRKVWDARVRQHLGTRYDARRGCFDWDLTMKLYDRGCGVIYKQHYSRWRESGVAFEMREGLYCIANQSLLSTRVFSRRGDKVGLRGYWGDIVSSPYLSFGIETEDKELLKKQNNQHVKTAQDISVANVQTLFKSLSKRAGHTHVSELAEESVDGTAETQPEPSVSRDETQQPEDKPDDKTHAEEKQNHTSHRLDLMTLNGIRVSFLSLDSLPRLSTKSRYCRLFNAVYCSASMVHHLDSSLTQIAAPDAVLIVELAKYLLDLSKEQEAGFATRVSEIAREAGFVPAHAEDDETYAVFTLQKDQ